MVVSLSDVPIDLVERVEILHVGSSEFSSAGIAGTINVILKKISRFPESKLKSNIAYQNRQRSTFSWLGSKKQENLNYSLSAQFVDNRQPSNEVTLDSYVITNKKNQITQEYFRQRDESSFSQLLRLSPNIQYKVNEEFTMNWSSSLAANRATESDQQKYQFIIGDNLPFSSDTKKSQREIFTLSNDVRIKFTPSENSNLDLKVGFYRGAFDIRTKEFGLKPADNFILQRTTKYRSFPRNLSALTKFTSVVSNQHNVVAGFEASRSTSEFNYLQQTSRSERNEIASNNQKSKSDVDSIALFVQDEWKFRKNSSIYLGIRNESISTNSYTNYERETRNTASVLSPSIQLLWLLNNDNSDRLRVGVARAYKAPSGAQLSSWKTISVNNSVQDPNTQGNPSLRPELAWTIHGSYEHSGNSGWNTNIRTTFRSVLDMHRENIAFLDNAWYLTTINAGHGISKTLELDSQLPLKVLFEHAPDLELNFSISKNWSRVSYLPSPDNLLNPISLSGNIGLDYQAKDFPLNFGFSSRFSSSRWQQINLVTRRYSPMPVALDVYASWTFDKNTQLRFATNNVLKQRNESQSQYIYEENKINQSTYVRQYREFNITLDHKF